MKANGNSKGRKEKKPTFILPLLGKILVGRQREGW
jgi:hypothetical protein